MKTEVQNFNEAMKLAFAVATKSPDPSTQNGAVIVRETTNVAISAACNEFPFGVEYTEERWERPLKYSFIEHAERNAIFEAALIGDCTAGATMVCPWAACADCARAIAQAGIHTLVRLPLDYGTTTHDRWVESCKIGDTIMREAGVEIIEHDFANVELPSLLRNGEEWTHC